MAGLSGRGRDWRHQRVQNDVKRGVPVAEAFHNDYKWRKLRNHFVKEYQPCCQMCGYKKKLEVHHALPWHVYPTCRYKLHNLITLCKSCHFSYGHFHNWKNNNPGIFKLALQTQVLMPNDDWGAYVSDPAFLENLIDKPIETI